MDTYQTKFEGLIGKLQAERDAAINQLSTLHRQYTELIGKEDLSIQERIAAMEKQYDIRIAQLKNMHLGFSVNMAMSDDRLRIKHANERILYAQEPVYQVADDATRKKIQNRTLKEGEYWALVFPEAKAESKEGVKGKSPLNRVFDPVRSAVRDIFNEAQGLAIPTSRKPSLDEIERSSGFNR